MTKAIHHAVVTVMAVQTRSAVCKDMGGCKGTVALSMAGFAGLDIERGDVSAVTILALERYILCLELVRREKEARHLMRILPPFNFGQRGCCAAMFGMTGAAFRRRVNGIHAPMRCHHILHLSGDVGMTNDTAILHGLIFPGSNMTGAAGAGNLRMGMNAAQQISWGGVQVSGAEHLTATGEGKAGDDKGGNQRRNETGTG